ncbi:MAG TPA: hypothetical protein VNF99_00680 [Stellaceae bacterium]|nr:hypothetical protein [Stellaceae bacterium]
MRISSILRSGILALSLMATMGAMTAAFAHNASRVQQQEQASTYSGPQASTSNTGPYDSPDFAVPPSDIH